MREEKRNLYRIDPAKVQQKIYELYPANSVVRKKMLENAKKQELDRLNKTIEDFPFDLTEMFLRNSVKRSQFLILSALMWLICFGGFMFIIDTYATTMLEFALLGGFGLVCCFRMCKRLILLVKELVSARGLSQAMFKMIEKFSDLKKKV